jgi:hypothetical protein
MINNMIIMKCGPIMKNCLSTLKLIFLSKLISKVGIVVHGTLGGIKIILMQMACQSLLILKNENFSNSCSDFFKIILFFLVLLFHICSYFDR